MTAARAELSSLEARIAAEQARYVDPPPAEELANLMRAASRAERQAKLLRAESDLLTQSLPLMLNPGGDMADLAMELAMAGHTTWAKKYPKCLLAAC